MKNYYVVSLCKNGLIGGGIAVQSDAITYHTGKITVAPEYRNIEMKYEQIDSFKTGRIFIFPTVTIKMSNGREYKFVVFAKRRFVDMLKDKV